VSEDENMGCGLLDGPRGRLLCFSILQKMLARQTEGTRLLQSEQDLYVDLKAELNNMRHADLLKMVTNLTQSELLLMIAATVSQAVYWQPPESIEKVLQRSEIILGMQPLAVLLDNKIEVISTLLNGPNSKQYLTRHSLKGVVDDGATIELAEIRKSDSWSEWLANELLAELAYSTSLGRRNRSGTWWSTPIGSGVMSSTGSVESVPIGLYMVEDDFDWNSAETWSLSIEPDCRIFDVNCPIDWQELFSSSAIDVTNSRSDTWNEVVGTKEKWLIPNWKELAEHYDGIHLSLSGYLTLSGRTLSVGDHKTLLAGWNPDETLWLNNKVHVEGLKTHWMKIGDRDLQWAIVDQF